MRNQTQHINFEKLMEINFALEKMYPQNTYKVDQEFWDGELSLSACLGVRSRPPRSNKTANRAGMPAVASGQIEPTIKYEVILGLRPCEKAALLKVQII